MPQQRSVKKVVINDDDRKVPFVHVDYLMVHLGETWVINNYISRSLPMFTLVYYWDFPLSWVILLLKLHNILIANIMTNKCVLFFLFYYSVSSGSICVIVLLFIN